MGETADRKPGRVQKWREKRHAKGEQRRRRRAEKRLDALPPAKGAPGGSPMGGIGGLLIPAEKPQREPLSPVNLPSGCYLHPRCYRASEICSQSAPHWSEPRPAQFVACHIHEPEAAAQE